ncbi:PREDICTED: probable glutathione S-transferase [Nelumbo nucifera]|uniref:Glutathione S-transferase n=2 Tax=Nelumbo nucifera TaxID=4432 RepID=A0A1U8AVC0_NELNU|nr:PREDICTED: probable glutathione S-transferase [Nelumbo nucifera]DAD42934.1 TPA_asm: hypothetical protein HUJ06_001164 [Nelumbo nucifera]
MIIDQSSWQQTTMGVVDLKLLGTKLSPFSRRVEWVLKLKGVKYEFIEENLFNKSSLLLASNPYYEKIPVLIHAGKPISESICILEYIEERWKGNPIMPEDPYERARARLLAKFADEKFFEAIKTAFESIGEVQARAAESAMEALKILEGEIKGKKFFGGDRIGMLDIVVGWIAYWLQLVEEAAGFKVMDSKKFPWLHLWMKNFLEVKIIKENLPPYDELRPFFHYLRKVKLDCMK